MAWDEEVGGRNPDVWEGVTDVACPHCLQPEGKRCVNPISGVQRRLPCLTRLQRKAKS